MGCVAGIAGCLLYLFNIIFFLLGAVVLGLGIWLQVDSSSLDIGGVTLPSAESAGSVWSAAVWIFIAVGAFTFIVAFLGCCGVSKKSECLLTAYTFLVGLTLLMELVAAILAIVFSSQINGSLGSEMYTQVNQQYLTEKYEEDGSVSEAWNLMQWKWKCCGSYSYTDYKNSTFKEINNQTVPYECCTHSDSGGTPDELNLYNKPACETEAACTGESCTFAYLNPKGCYEVLHDWVQDHSKIVIGVGFAFALAELICLLFGCLIKNDIKKHMMVV